MKDFDRPFGFDVVLSAIILRQSRRVPYEDIFHLPVNFNRPAQTMNRRPNYCPIQHNSIAQQMINRKLKIGGLCSNNIGYFHESADIITLGLAEFGVNEFYGLG
jgi:hypothetical protein